MRKAVWRECAERGEPILGPRGNRGIKVSGDDGAEGKVGRDALSKLIDLISQSVSQPVGQAVSRDAFSR